VLRYDPATNTHSRPWSLLDSIAKGSNPNDLSPVAGLQDLTFTTDGRLLGVFGFRGDPATRPTGTSFATLVQFDSSSSTPTVLADLGAFETAFPSHTPPFSNPFSLAWNAGVSYITDAGANRLLKVNDASSVVEKLEDFPKIVSTIPPAEAVPTGLAASPAGTLYNTQLPGFPFTPGIASIFASMGTPNSATTITSGFTNVMDLSFGADGWLYLVEYAQNFLSPVGTGSLRRFNPITLERQLLADSIDRPTGVLVRYTPGPLPIAGAAFAWRQARVLRRRVKG